MTLGIKICPDLNVDDYMMAPGMEPMEPLDLDEGTVTVGTADGVTGSTSSGMTSGSTGMIGMTSGSSGGITGASHHVEEIPVEVPQLTPLDLEFLGNIILKKKKRSIQRHLEDLFTPHPNEMIVFSDSESEMSCSPPKYSINAIDTTFIPHDPPISNSNPDIENDPELAQILENLVNPPKPTYQQFVCYDYDIHQDEIARFKFYIQSKLQLSEIHIMEIMPYNRVILFKILESESLQVMVNASKLSDVGYRILAKEDYLKKYPSIL